MRCVDCSGLTCTHKDPNNPAGLTLTEESLARRVHGRVGMKMEEDYGDLISPSTLERRCPRGATTLGKKPWWSG